MTLHERVFNSGDDVTGIRVTGWPNKNEHKRDGLTGMSLNRDGLTGMSINGDGLTGMSLNSDGLTGTSINGDCLT
jgi:hypothetical protein